MRHLNQRNTKGETLVETLVAVLVCALSIVMLLMATTTATDLNKKAEDRDAQLNQEQIAAEYGDYVGTATVTFDGKTYGVQLFGGDDVVAYQVTSGGN